MRRHAILWALTLAACSQTAPAPPRDGGDDLAPVDVPTGVFDVIAPPRDVAREVRFDDVDQSCPNGATDRCLFMPPGPCANLSDGVEHTVRFTGFRQDHTLSCAGRMTGMGPDAVLPLTIREATDVSITVAPGTGDTVIAALVPADQCGVPAREFQCLNGSSSIGGIVVLRVPSVTPGEYAVVVGTVRGVDARVTAALAPARVRDPGDICPGVALVPDGAPVSIDTRRFLSTADYGTSCGTNATRGLGWVDGVASFTTTEARDVTVSVDGDGEEDIHVEITRVCGAGAFVIPGCDIGLPARRTIRNLAAGTYWATIDYRPTRRPDHTLSVRVTTAPPTLPGPASRCPGVPLAVDTAAVLDVDTLTAGPSLTCLPRQRFSGFLTFEAPSMPADVLVNVAAPTPRNNAALALRTPCEGDVIDACVGPLDRAASSVWRRYRGLTPGSTYTVQAATDAVGGQLTVRRVHVAPVTPESVTGNVTCAAAHVIPAGGGVFTGTTAGATAVAVPSCATAMSGCGGSRGALYRLDLATRSRVVASLEGTGFDTLLAIQPGDTCPGRASMFSGACNDDWYGTNSAVDATLNAGRYWVIAGGCGAAQGGAYQLDVAVLRP